MFVMWISLKHSFWSMGVYTVYTIHANPSKETQFSYNLSFQIAYFFIWWTQLNVLHMCPRGVGLFCVRKKALNCVVFYWRHSLVYTLKLCNIIVHNLLLDEFHYSAILLKKLENKNIVFVFTPQLIAIHLQQAEITLSLQWYMMGTRCHGLLVCSIMHRLCFSQKFFLYQQKSVRMYT